MNEEQVKLVEELKSARSVSDKPFELSLKVSILCHNDSKTLSACIHRVTQQGIIPNIEVIDTGSKDGCLEMIDKQIENKHWFPAKISLKREKINLNKHETKAWYRTKVVKECKTKYLMFLNASVLLPPYCLRPMIEHLAADTNLAMIGLRYDPNAYHIQMGAAVFKTAIAKQLDWKPGKQCACRTVRDQLVSMGYKIEQADDMLALHLTGGML